MSSTVQEVCHLEPKHLSGKGGIGKGSQRRFGSDPELYRAGWERIFGGNGTDRGGQMSSKDQNITPERAREIIREAGRRFVNCKAFKHSANTNADDDNPSQGE